MKIDQKYILTGAIVAVAVISVVLMALSHARNPRTRDGQVRAEVIQVTPRISGPVIKLNIVDNQFVKAGDLLFEIDPRTFEADLAQARAQYDEAKDNYTALEKKVESAQAQVKVSEASVIQAEAAINQVDARVLTECTLFRGFALLASAAFFPVHVGAVHATEVAQGRHRRAGFEQEVVSGNLLVVR